MFDLLNGLWVVIRNAFEAWFMIWRKLVEWHLSIIASVIGFFALLVTSLFGMFTNFLAELENIRNKMQPEGDFGLDAVAVWLPRANAVFPLDVLFPILLVYLAALGSVMLLKGINWAIARIEGFIPG